MACCEDIAVFVPKSRIDLPFSEMDVIETFPDWCHLLQCKTCWQKWISDEWDKGQYLITFKVYDADIVDRAKIRSKYSRLMIINQHGGESDEKCLWKDCDNFALKNMKICIDHLMKR